MTTLIETAPAPEAKLTPIEYINNLAKGATGSKLKWDEQRQAVEAESLGTFLGKYNIDSLPKLTALRWNIAGPNSTRNAFERLLTYYIRNDSVSDRDSRKRERKMADALQEQPLLVDIGAGDDVLERPGFGKQVILIDPDYDKPNLQRRNQSIWAEKGYTFVPRQFDISMLENFGSTNIAVSLNNVLHHIEDPTKMLQEILDHNSVKAVTIADYASPKFSDDPYFILSEFFNLYGSWAESAELEALGLVPFIKSHDSDLSQPIVDLIKEQGFSVQTEYYPKADPRYDHLSGLTDSQKAILERGTKFVITAFKK